jgi:hypothetical protein
MRSKLALGVVVVLFLVGLIGSTTGSGPKIRANTDHIIACVDSLANLHQVPEDAYSLHAALDQNSTIPNNPANKKGIEKVHFMEAVDESGAMEPADSSFAVTGDILYKRTPEGYKLWQVVVEGDRMTVVLKDAVSL